MIRNYLLIALVLSILNAMANGDCGCRMKELEDNEKLNKLLFRKRIEYSDGRRKYNISNVNQDSMIECNSVVLYELITDLENGKYEKRCRTCQLSGWSNLSDCSRPRCDLDHLVGQPTIKLANGAKPIDDHKLFEPGSVLAVFKFSRDKVCKICQINGEWSRFAEADLCSEITTTKPNSDCSIELLKQIEMQQYDYIRLRIEAPNGIYKLDEKNIKGDKVPANTVAVYQRYLSNLPVKSTSSSDYSGNPFTKKFCRYCDGGVWSDIESCVKLNCDKDQLTGQPELNFVSNKLKPIEQQSLFQPYSVIATTSFGTEKFCKQCHENGEWSRFSLKELCNEQASKRLNEKLVRTHNRDESEDELFKKEMTCDLESLKHIESNYKDIENIYFVSSNRKQKLFPKPDASIPSRTLSIYKSTNQAIVRHFCSICVNGVWSNITNDCNLDSGIYFCEREKLTLSAELVDEKGPVPVSQDLFEPGTVMAVYEISETTKLCKICLSYGESAKWSSFAEPSLCDPDIAFFKSKLKAKALTQRECLLSNLIASFEFKKEYILTWDARRYVLDERIPDGSVAVFRLEAKDQAMSNFKWCRKCNNGKWETNYTICPIEFSLKKCDPSKLRSFDYLVYTHDGARLTDEERKQLAMPGKIAVVYEFGPQRYCKTCNEDGNWSSYPQINLCDTINWEYGSK